MPVKYTLKKKFISYGHYELTVKDSSGNEKSAITGNTDLIYRLSSEDTKDRKEATDEAIAFVLESK